MRIMRIKAVNFLAHANTELDLTGFDSYVVIGKNGAGKSSLVVDVPLVALFGKGRDSDLDDFIKLGKDAMIAGVDYATADGCFRVTRKRSRKTARGTTLLEMYQIDEKGEVLKEMTLGTISDTQALIEKNIGIDYDTLVKTSVIEQTEAEKFCLATPAERMDLLVKIWDLEKYDELGQLAKEERTAIEATVKANDQACDILFRKVQEAKEKSIGLKVLKKDVETKDHNVKSYEKQKAQLQEQITALDGYARELKTIDDFIKKTQKEIEQIAQSHGEVLAKIGRFEKIVKNQDVVKSKVEEEKVLIGEQEKHETKRREVDTRIEKALADVDLIVKEMNGWIKELEVEKTVVQEQIDRVDKQMRVLNDDKVLLGKREEQLAQMKKEAGKLVGIQCHPDYDAGYINTDCRFIKDAVIARDKMPLFEGELESQSKEIERVSVEATSLKEELIGKKKAFDDKIGSHKKEIEAVVGKRDISVTVLREEKTGYENEIENVKKSLLEVRRFTVLMPEISLAEQELPKLKDEEKGLTKKTEDQLKEKEKLLKDKEKLLKHLAGKTDLERQLQVTCNSLESEKKVRDEAMKTVGAIEQMVAQIEPMKEEMKKYDAEKDKLNGEKALLASAEDAYRAIPYMVISRGVGSMENVANEILAVASQNGLRVSIETTKVTKTTKKIRDDLHVVITDQDGEKKYKMLSGGERALVAMSLRLGASEVLAHRRAVRIESLIADEPFGPLDVEVIEDMKTAIRNLKDRFKIMGIITHVERAQDVFPVQIEVLRGKEGATVRVTGDYA